MNHKVYITLTNEFISQWAKNGPCMLWLKEFVGVPMIKWKAGIDLEDQSKAYFLFETQEEAMAFKIRWGGNIDDT